MLSAIDGPIPQKRMSPLESFSLIKVSGSGLCFGLKNPQKDTSDEGGEVDGVVSELSIVMRNVPE